MGALVPMCFMEKFIWYIHVRECVFVCVCGHIFQGLLLKYISTQIFLQTHTVSLGKKFGAQGSVECRGRRWTKIGWQHGAHRKNVPSEEDHKPSEHHVCSFSSNHFFWILIRPNSSTREMGHMSNLLSSYAGKNRKSHECCVLDAGIQNRKLEGLLGFH